MHIPALLKRETCVFSTIHLRRKPNTVAVRSQAQARGRSLAKIAGSNLAAGMGVCRCLCDEPITGPGKSYRVCGIVCDHKQQ